MNKEPWIDTRLSDEEMRFLHQAISDAKGRRVAFLDDKDNWFFETALKKLTERLFYDDWDNYRKFHLRRDEFPSEFEMDRYWVNYQKQNEFNPLHGHDGLYSFVVFIKIPTHGRDQHVLNYEVSGVFKVASDFMFVWSERDNTDSFLRTKNFTLSPEDEGRMLFFPAWLQHMVYPFYECEEERITISGNIVLYDPNRPEKVPVDPKDQILLDYEEKKNQLRNLENGVADFEYGIKQIKEEMKRMIND